MNAPTHSRPKVGVGVWIEHEGKLLLAKRVGDHGGATWSSLGGHLEFGETPEQCARREAHEEGGVILTKVAFIGITNDVFEATGLHYITIWMRGWVESPAVLVNAPDEHSEIGWFPLGDLPQPLFLPMINVFEGYGYMTQATWRE